MEAAGQAAFGVFHGDSGVNAAKVELAAQGLPSVGVSILYPPHHTFSQDKIEFHEAISGTGVLVGSLSGATIFVLIGLTIALLILDPSDTDPMAGRTTAMVALGTLVIGGFLGGMLGGLVGIGSSNFLSAVERLIQDVQSGGILMSVHVNNSVEVGKIRAVLKKFGAEDISVLDELESWKTVKDKIRSFQ